MALHLPKPRSKKPVQQAVGLDGLKVSVSKAATSGVEKSKTVKTGGLAGLTSKVSVKQIRKEIGKNGLRQATNHPRTAPCADGHNKAASPTPTSLSARNAAQRSSDSAG